MIFVLSISKRIMTIAKGFMILMFQNCLKIIAKVRVTEILFDTKSG